MRYPSVFLSEFQTRPAAMPKMTISIPTSDPSSPYTTSSTGIAPLSAKSLFGPWIQLIFLFSSYLFELRSFVWCYFLVDLFFCFFQHRKCLRQTLTSPFFLGSAGSCWTDVNGRLKCGQTMCFPYCICCCYWADDQSKWKSDVVMPLDSDRIKSIWVQSIRSMLDLFCFCFFFFRFCFFPDWTCWSTLKALAIRPSRQ